MEMACSMALRSPMSFSSRDTKSFSSLPSPSSRLAVSMCFSCAAAAAPGRYAHLCTSFCQTPPPAAHNLVSAVPTAGQQFLGRHLLPPLPPPASPTPLLHVPFLPAASACSWPHPSIHEATYKPCSHKACPPPAPVALPRNHSTHNKHLQRRQVQQEALVLARRLGHHVDQQVGHLEGAGKAG